MNDLDFMTLAVLEAEAAMRRLDVPVGAVLVKDGKVLAVGSNAKTTDPTAHAEIKAIRAGAERIGDWNLRNCDLYVTLEPCPMCAGACVNARIRTIIFGASDPKAGAVGTLYDIPSDRRLNHRCVVRSGVLKERCEALLKEYFIKRRMKSE